MAPTIHSLLPSVDIDLTASALVSKDVASCMAYLPEKPNAQLVNQLIAALQPMGLTLPESLQRAVPKRQYEFLAGRYVAAQALTLAAQRYRLVLPNCSLPIQPDRSPAWPAGWIGSISHSKGMVMAVAAPTTCVQGLGIDIEHLLDESVAQEVSDQILTAAEQDRWLHHIDSRTAAAQTTLIFSAKEALFKAMAPLAKAWFGFLDAEIIKIGKDGEFCWTLTKDVGQHFYAGLTGTGRHLSYQNWVITSIQLP